MSRSGDEQRLSNLKENIQPVKEFVEIQVNSHLLYSRDPGKVTFVFRDPVRFTYDFRDPSKFMVSA